MTNAVIHDVLRTNVVMTNAVIHDVLRTNVVKIHVGRWKIYGTVAVRTNVFKAIGFAPTKKKSYLNGKKHNLMKTLLSIQLVLLATNLLI
jgi:hypothetical protein